jgi:hypothetical protein
MRGRQRVSRASCADFDAGVVDGVDQTLKWLKCGGRLSRARSLYFDPAGRFRRRTTPSQRMLQAWPAPSTSHAHAKDHRVRVADKRHQGGPDRPARLRQCAPRGGDVVILLDHPSPTPPRRVGEAPCPSTSPGLSTPERCKVQESPAERESVIKTLHGEKRLAGTCQRHATRRVFDPKPRKK